MTRFFFFAFTSRPLEKACERIGLILSTYSPGRPGRKGRGIWPLRRMLFGSTEGSSRRYRKTPVAQPRPRLVGYRLREL